MRNKVKAALVLACFFGFVAELSAAKSAGNTGFTFLKSSPFARSAGMADATSAFIGDILSIYSNPAGLAHLTAKEVSVQHISHLEDITYDNVALAFPTRRGGWGANVGLLSVNNIPKTRTSSAVSDRFEESGEVEAGDQYAVFSWGRRQSRNWALGSNLKLVRETLDSHSALSAMLDAGFIYRVNYLWRLAGVVQNAGAGAKFISKKVSPPSRVRAGLYYFPEDWMEWEFDLVQGLDGTAELSSGGELNWEQKAFLRLGYRYRLRTSDLGPWAGAALGVGAKLKSLRIDYAFLPFEDLGSSHRASLTWRFGSATASERPSAPAGNAVGERPKKTAVAPLKTREKLTVAVMDFEGKNVSESEASVVSDLMRTKLVQTNVFIVVERRHMDQILREQAFQQWGCTTNECAVQVGELLSVRKMVVGTLSKLGRRFFITANMVDVETGRIEASESSGSVTLEEIPESANGIAWRLAVKALK